MRDIYPVFLWLFFFSCIGGNGKKVKHDLIPPDGKKMYFSHQHSYSTDQERLFDQSTGNKGPAGIVFYTSILMDLSNHIVEGNQIEDLVPFLDQNKNICPVLIMLVDKTMYRRIQEGEFDDRIERLAKFLTQVDRPIYLSIGFDVNHPIYGNEPSFYVSTYRYLVDKLRQYEVGNLSLVWHIISMSPGYRDKDPIEWFPGQDYVDWLGTNVTQILDAHVVTKVRFQATNFERLFSIADEFELPIMIMESSSRSVQKNFGYKGEALWEFWYKPFFDFVEGNKRVKAFSHMTQDWLMDDVIWGNFTERLADDRYVFANHGSAN